MGIKDLYKKIKSQYKKQEGFQIKQHNIIDFNNIFYQKILVKQPINKQFTPQMKVQKLLDLLKNFADRDKKFYIVVDPMGNKQRVLNFDFTEYNNLIYPNTIKYINEQKIFQLCDQQGNILNQIDIKQIKQEKRRKSLKCEDTGNSGGCLLQCLPLKQNSYDILKLPIYNYMILQQFFKDCPNVSIINAQFEADVSIGILVDKLIRSGVDKNDITIMSRDSDMILYSKGCITQSEQQYIQSSNINGLQHPEYLFLCGSDYSQQLVSIDEYFRSDQKKLYDKIKEEKIKNLDLQFIVSDIIYVNYNIIQTSQQIINFNIESLEESCLCGVIFLQKILHTKYMNLQQIKQSLKLFSQMSDEQFIQLVEKVFNNHSLTQYFREEEVMVLDHYKKWYYQLFKDHT